MNSGTQCNWELCETISVIIRRVEQDIFFTCTEMWKKTIGCIFFVGISLFFSPCLPYRYHSSPIQRHGFQAYIHHRLPTPAYITSKNLRLTATAPSKSSMVGSKPKSVSQTKRVQKREHDATCESLFKEWEEEERELYKQELEEKRARLIESGEEDKDYELPNYMVEILNELDDQDGVPPAKLPVLAIIGRPNTGKSTLFNKIVDSYKDGAIVHDEPGITRDRAYKVGTWDGYNFQVVDTGGIVFDDTEDVFADKITEQALIALREASAAIFVCDGKEGLTELDESIARWLRRNNKVPVFIAVSKCESHKTGFLQANEFWSLGFGRPYAVSGIHGTGVGELLSAITNNTMEKVVNILQENVTNVALVGRPNVGKSSLFNRLYGKERTIVSNVAGTTRDAIDVTIHSKGESFCLIDTAGIRKKGKIDYGPEFFMINRAFKAIRRAEVVVLVLDATAGIVEQDRILAQRIHDEGRSCVIALNKWDAILNKDDKSFDAAVHQIRTSLPILQWADVVVLSALTGQRSDKLLDVVSHAAQQFKRRVKTSVLNEVVFDSTVSLSPPKLGTRAGRIYYCMQVCSCPPTIVFFVNDPSLFTDNYKKYLERKIRQQLKLDATPIKMIFRGKSLRDISRSAQKGYMGKTAQDAILVNSNRCKSSKLENYED